MKTKLLSLMTLLVLCVTGAWGAETELFGSFSGTTKTDYFKAYTVGGKTVTVSTPLSISSSGGDYYVNINSAASNNGANYVEVSVSGATIKSVSFALTGNGDDKTCNPALLGWESSVANTSTADYETHSENKVVAKRGVANKEWFTYDLSAQSLSIVRIYKSVKGVDVGGETTNKTTFGNGQTVQFYGVSVELADNDERSSLTLSFLGEGGASSVDIGSTLNTNLTWSENTSSEEAKYSKSYTTSNASIATVSAEGVITGVAEGTATITALVTAAADATYKTTSTTLRVTVVDPSKVYTLSDASASLSLSKAAITANAYLAVTTNNWSTGSDPYDEIDPPFYNMSSVGRDLTINVKGVAAFVVRNMCATAGRTYGISVDNTELATIVHGGTGIESSGLFVTGSTGAVTIKLSGKGTGSTYPIRIILYKEVPSLTSTVTVGEKGFATYVNSDYALDFTGKSIQAYTINSTDGSALTLTQKAKVAKGEPVLLYSATASDSQDIPVILNSEATKADDNKLVAGDNKTHTWAEGSKEHYILYTGGMTPGFWQANDSMVKFGKAYLDLTGISAGARSFDLNLGEGETTGVVSVGKPQTAGNREVYNLAGQRVAQPTKGLYIVNGRKVVIR